MPNRTAEILPGIHVRQAAAQRTARTEPATRHGWSCDWTAPYLLDGERIQSRFFVCEGDADEALQALLMSERMPATMYRPLWCGQLWRVDRRHHG